MSDQISNSEEQAAPEGLTPQREKQAQESAIQGKAGSIDQATRQAILDKQDIKMNNPVNETPVEEVEVEVEVEVEDTSEALRQAFQNANLVSEEFNTTDLLSLVGDSFEAVNPEFTLQIIVPLMGSDLAEELTVEDTDGVEWSFNNCLAKTGREGKHSGVIYDSLVGVLERMDTLNSSNFIIAGNALTQSSAIHSISKNFYETADLNFPSVATEEAFQNLIGFVPTLGTSPTQDLNGVVVSLMVPMPIVSTGSVSIQKFLHFLSSIVSKYSVPTEVMFVADPVEFVYDDVQLNNVRELSELGFQVLTLENLNELVESDEDGWPGAEFDEGTYDEDEDGVDEDEDDFDTSENDEDQDEDEDEDVEDEDEDVEDEDEDEELSDSIQLTIPLTMQGIDQTLFDNGIQALSTMLICKKL